ncbi:MAG: single-stranded DNA-binding protein [Solobacterium sp.]|nr:single-stranded DNA-binding protein [Solobacterium sp.]
MSGINHVVLVGRITRDVEVRKTPAGTSLATFTVACDRRYASSQNNANGQQTADFINCVAWRQSADFLGSYAKKGTLVGVEGSIQTRNYTNQSGQKVYVTEVVCDRVQILESRSTSQSRNNDSYSAPDPVDPYSSGSYSANDSSFDTGPSLDISSDDLPF